MTSGNRNAPPEQGSWNISGATPRQDTSGYPAGNAGAGRGRNRPLVVALVVALVDLVIIAAVCNQAVTKHALRYYLDHGTSLKSRIVSSSLQFAWRFDPIKGDNRNGVHYLYSEFVTIAVFVVLSAFLAAVAARRLAGFGQVFLATWTGCVAAAYVARFVGALVTRSPMGGRLSFALFVAPTGTTLFAGLVIGLVAGLLGALFAAATRRRPEAPVHPAAPATEPAYTPEAPPPFYGRQDDDPRDTASGYRDRRAENETAAFAAQPRGDGEHGTQRLPDPRGGPREESGRVSEVESGGEAGSEAEGREGDNRTTQLPRFDPRGGQHWTPPEGEGQSTQALPNAPDDGRH
ncbi:hypothetical protein [uncultured Jatrophihabitans sp.]|uniref:hypothetical protein n=1 Tax=uncultured Jatrophihabitans sp. TaxID=1610747 RepID=UPI0035C98E5B